MTRFMLAVILALVLSPSEWVHAHRPVLLLHGSHPCLPASHPIKRLQYSSIMRSLPIDPEVARAAGEPLVYARRTWGSRCAP